MKGVGGLQARRELGVWSIGDPRDPRTWSATPACLISAFERLNISVLANSGYSPGGADRPYSAGAIIRGIGARRFRHYWGPDHDRLVRRWRAFRADNPSPPVVHTDVSWLDAPGCRRTRLSLSGLRVEVVGASPWFPRIPREPCSRTILCDPCSKWRGVHDLTVGASRIHQRGGQ